MVIIYEFYKCLHKEGGILEQTLCRKPLLEMGVDINYLIATMYFNFL